MNELHEEEMYVFIATDGEPQLATLAPDFAFCVAIAELFAKSGVCKTPAKMFEEGYKILPVKVTLTVNGTEDDAFNSAKKLV